MKTADAIALAREVKAKGPLPANAPKCLHALVALLDHGDAVQIPNFETSVRMVAANMHAQGKFYVEIAVDPETKEVGWTFEPTERHEGQAN